MAEQLLVVAPFGDYAMGDIITDDLKVAQLRTRVGFVVASQSPELVEQPVPLLNTPDGAPAADAKES